jgi:hypothetical protein
VKGDRAFVFGYREYDDLYDGDCLLKIGEEWIHRGNLQADTPEGIAENLIESGFFPNTTQNPETARSTATSPALLQRIQSYAVGKRVTDFPEGAIDLFTPEAAYALSNRIIGDDNPHKIERLRQYTMQQKLPEPMEQWITSMTPEVRAQMMNAEILHVFIYRDKHAMVIAEVVKGEKYNNRLLSKRDGHWLSVGGGGLYNGKSAEEVVKMNEGAFTKLADGWDKAMEEPAAATVEGKIVTEDGLPLANMIVRFMPRDKTKGEECIGVTNQDGKYSLSQRSGDNKKDIPPGEYRVVVVREEYEASMTIAGSEPAKEEPRINRMYADERTTPLAATVEPGSNRFDFELTR